MTPTRYEQIQEQCAHFGGVLPGRCLILERDWAPGLTHVTRCRLCPHGSEYRVSLRRKPDGE